MTKTNQVLQMLLKRRTVSKLTTLPLGVGNLPDCVLKLRRRGYYIDVVEDVDGAGHTFTRYELTELEGAEFLA